MTKFKPLRILMTQMHPKKIKQVFNTAFGGNAVKRVIRDNETIVIHFDQENEQRPEFWDDLYRTLDEFGSVWIESTYLGDEEFPHGHIKFFKEPIDGHWEVRYAKNTKSTDFDTVPVKVCTCSCTCGAGRSAVR